MKNLRLRSPSGQRCADDAYHSHPWALDRSARFEPIKDRRVQSIDTSVGDSGSWTADADWNASVPTSTLDVSISSASAATITVATGCDLTVGGSYSAATGATLSIRGGGSIIHPAANRPMDSDFETPVVEDNKPAPSCGSTSGSAYRRRPYALPAWPIGA